MSADEIVDRMQEVRSDNNKLWMDYVRLAFEVAPERAKAIARQIEGKDAEIRHLWKELGR